MRDLPNRLRQDGFRPWLDKDDILPGMEWEHAIEDAVRDSDAVIVCVSHAAMTKDGYLHLQKEISFVLDVADEKTPGSIFTVPLRLDECVLPRRLRKYQYIDRFEEGWYSQLIRSLTARAKQIGASVAVPTTPSKSEIRSLETEKPVGELDKANDAARSILERTGLRPKIGLILGSGLGSYVQKWLNSTTLNFEDIPHFPTSTALGHSGKLIVGTKTEVAMAAMQGRFHLYEGLKLDQVVFPVRVFARMGIRAVVLTAAAGILNPELPIGSLIALSDHINLLGASPLIGTNEEGFGPRFPDMTEVYSKRYRYLAHLTADELGLKLFDGVYAVHSGPAYETPAEIRSMRNMGADLVGMSTVPEAIAARHAGFQVLALCIGTNYGAGIMSAPASHEEVLNAAKRLQERFAALLDGVIPRISADLGASD